MTTKFETNSGILLPTIIKQLGPGLKGIELGVWYGNNSGYLLQECSNILELYGIDPYEPYQDWNRYIQEKDIKEIRNIAIQNLSIFNQRFKLLETTSKEARIKFENNTIDFIFIDGDHSFERCYEDLHLYYDVIKSGGLFSGHDFTLPGVNRALKEFRKERQINCGFKVISNDVWYWIKD